MKLAKYGPDSNAARNIKFLGCAMESIRSSLAELVHGGPVVLDSQDSDLDSEDSDLAQFDWNPPIPFEKI